MAESNSNRFCSPSVFETVLGPAQLTFQIGGTTGDRTPDLLHAMQALSQLSYGPNKKLQTIRFRRGVWL